MMNPPTLVILISTYNERINNVVNVLLPQREDVCYIVSHQFSDEIYKSIPPGLIRDDVCISQIHGRGVTKSRNNCIRLANGEIGLFSDDDVSYKDEWINTILLEFSKNDKMDIGVFKIKTYENQPDYREWDTHRFNLNEKYISIGTIQIAFRIDSLQKAGVFFDERFGAGQDILIGNDENFFIEDCLAKGLTAIYIPEFVVSHPYISTVKSIAKYDNRMIGLAGGISARKFNYWSILKAIGSTILLLPDFIKYKVNPFRYFFVRLKYSLFIIKTNKNFVL